MGLKSIGFQRVDLLHLLASSLPCPPAWGIIYTFMEREEGVTSTLPCFYSGKAPLWIGMKGRVPRLASLGARSANFCLSLELVSFQVLIQMSGTGDKSTRHLCNLCPSLGEAIMYRSTDQQHTKPSLAFMSHVPLLHESTIPCSTKSQTPHPQTVGTQGEAQQTR